VITIAGFRVAACLDGATATASSRPPIDRQTVRFAGASVRDRSIAQSRETGTVVSWGAGCRLEESGDTLVWRSGPEAAGAFLSEEDRYANTRFHRNCIA